MSSPWVERKGKKRLDNVARLCYILAMERVGAQREGRRGDEVMFGMHNLTVVLATYVFLRVGESTIEKHTKTQIYELLSIATGVKFTYTESKEEKQL